MSFIVFHCLSLSCAREQPGSFQTQAKPPKYCSRHTVAMCGSRTFSRVFLAKLSVIGFCRVLGYRHYLRCQGCVGPILVSHDRVIASCKRLLLRVSSFIEDFTMFLPDVPRALSFRTVNIMIPEIVSVMLIFSFRTVKSAMTVIMGVTLIFCATMVIFCADNRLL